MKYYVQVSNGKAEGVIFSESNLLDLTYTPDQLIGHPVFYELIRNEKPIFDDSENKVVEHPIYTVEDNCVVESWFVRDLTEEEIAQKAVYKKALAKDLLETMIVHATNKLNNDPNLTENDKTFLEDYIKTVQDLLTSDNYTWDDAANHKADFYYSS